MLCSYLTYRISHDYAIASYPYDIISVLFHGLTIVISEEIMIFVQDLLQD